MTEPRKLNESDPEEERFSGCFLTGWALINATVMLNVSFYGYILYKPFVVEMMGIILIPVIIGAHWFIFKPWPRHLVTSIVAASATSWIVGFGWILIRLNTFFEQTEDASQVLMGGIYLFLVTMIRLVIIASVATFIIGIVTQILVQRKQLGEKLFPKSTRRSFM